MPTLPSATFLPDFLEHQARVQPDATCWIYGERTWTFAEAWASVRRTAAALRASGIGRGDRVAVLEKNNPAILQLILGGSLIGAATTVVNWRLAGDELDYVVNDSGARLAVVGADLQDAYDLVVDKLDHVERAVRLGGDHDEYESWTSGAEPIDRQPDVVPEDVCVVMYSSGTTGRPKGVQLTQHAMVRHCYVGGGDAEYGDRSMMMVAMPMFHVGGTSYALLGLTHGVPAFVVKEVDPTLMAGAMLAGCTHAFLVPPVIAALLQAGEQAMALFGRLRQVGCGAAPMPPPVVRKVIEAWPDTSFMQVYGMTEFGGVISVLDDAAHRDLDRPERLLSVGQPVEGAELRVVDPGTLEDVPTGTSGELWFRTEQATIGYLGRPDATAELITDDGWVRTGDVGRVDDGGFIFIEDRIKDMIITGGENVYSPEVERVLAEHPAVLEAAVIGVPDDRWGETVKAVVALRPGTTATAEELIAFTREHLAHYKAPTTIDVIEALPRNPSGKILKRDLRKPYWGDQQRQV